MMEFNQLQMTALLHDTTAHIKFGSHMAPNYQTVKKQVLSAFGMKKASSIELLVCLGELYINHFGMEGKFMKHLHNSGLANAWARQNIMMTQEN